MLSKLLVNPIHKTVKTKRRHSLQNVYSQNTLPAPNKYQLNPDIIKKRNMEVMKEILDYMKKMHEAAVFEQIYCNCNKILESTIEESNKKPLKKMNTITGMKPSALLRQQFRKQRQLVLQTF
jgi:F0F1-type ATP synthase delta subunit